MVKVDVQGAETIKQVMPQAVAIFISPPTKEELFTRLKNRSTESENEMRVRLQAAEEEFQKLPAFDYVVINYQNEIDRTVAAISAIINVEKGSDIPKRPALENQLKQKGQ